MILIMLPYDTYCALTSGLKKSGQFSVKASTPIARTVTVKTGVSWKLWGENPLITISPATGGMSEISISSTSRYTLVDWGKNQENLNNILKLLSIELNNYKKICLQSSNPTNDIPTQIKKLSELRRDGILTEDEFQEKKKLLLDKM